MIRRTNLLTVAGIVWMLAGINVFRLGILALINTPAPWLYVFIATSLGVGVFASFMFLRLAGDHTFRIISLPEERYPIWNFLDVKGWIIMGIMMGGGIGLRVAGFIPTWFVALCYAGIGIGLMVAGGKFIWNRSTARF